MTVSYTPTYYPLPGGRSTSEPTPGPVSPTEAFYQEEQSGLCILQSLNAFAGRHVVDFTAYAQANNAYVMNAATPQDGFDSQPDRFLLESIDDLDNVDKSFVLFAPNCYITKNKKLFGLPDTCTIRTAFDEASDFEKTIQYIDEHPSIHRVASASISQKHTFTFRKDLSGQWRVIDSWSRYHNKDEQDPLKRFQPAFPTFKEALHAHSTRLENPTGRYCLIYPTEDTIPPRPPASPPPSSPAEEPKPSDTTPPSEDTIPPEPPASPPPSSPAEEPKPSDDSTAGACTRPQSQKTSSSGTSQACCLVRLWKWVIARICALFCCRKPQ